MKNITGYKRIPWQSVIVVLIFGSIWGKILPPGIAEAAFSAFSVTGLQARTIDQDALKNAENFMFYHTLDNQALLDSSHSPIGAGPDHRVTAAAQKPKEIQLAGIYTVPEPGYTRAYREHDHPSPVYSSIRKIHYILIGGLLLALGTIFVPTLFLQFHDHREKFVHLRAIVPKMPNAPLHFVHHSPDEPLSRLSSEISPAKQVVQHNIDAPQQNDEPRPVQATRPCYVDADSIFLEFHALHPATASAITTFFHQSGFESREDPERGLLVYTACPQYKWYGEIPVFILENSILNHILVQEIRTKVERWHSQVNGKVAIVIVDEIPDTQAYHHIYDYHARDNFTIIPIHHKLLIQAVRSSTCAQTLEDVIGLAMDQRDIYEMNTPVANPLYFFGRSTLMQQLADAVSHLQHIGVFGLRKIGKTSLIWQFKEGLTHHLVAYVNLQHLPRDCKYLYRQIILECVRDAAIKYPDVMLPALCLTGNENPENSSSEFIQDLVNIWECLKASRHDIKVILLLDEAEHLLPNRTENTDGFIGFHEFMGTMRGISQQHKFLVSMIVSSSPEISRIETWKGQNNPGFQYYKEVFLSFLSEEGCNHMISNLGARMGLKYTEESLSRIYYETAGDPYVTRQLCSIIARKLRTRAAESSEKHSPEVKSTTMTVQVKDVEDAVSEYIEYKYDYLESIWRRLPTREQQIIHTLISKDSCTLDELITSEQSHASRREQRKAISILIENKIVEKCENKYSITMGLFERFILTSN